MSVFKLTIPIAELVLPFVSLLHSSTASLTPDEAFMNQEQAGGAQIYGKAQPQTLTSTSHSS